MGRLGGRAWWQAGVCASRASGRSAEANGRGGALTGGRTYAAADEGRVRQRGWQAARRPGPAGIPSSPYRPSRIAWASSAGVATMWVAPASSSCSTLLKPQLTLMQGISALAAVWTSTSESPT